MSPRKRQTSPEYVQKILAHAEHQRCDDCGAAPGKPCNRPGSGRSVCRGRYIAAAIQMKQALRAAARTLDQQAAVEAILAGLPKVPREELEACRTAAGGYSFTRERLSSWGVPWPPPAGWRRALECGEDGGE